MRTSSASSCPGCWHGGWKRPARRFWQRLLGVLELIVGGGQLLFYFFSDNQTVTSIILAVMILAAVCILGPYYHWRKQEKENTQK